MNIARRVVTDYVLLLGLDELYREAIKRHESGELLEVASSPIYGEAVRHEKLLPVGRDALSTALLKTQPNWSIQSLTEAAFDIAHETDDYSLVGLAARAKNPIVLTALRESVVLYAELICDIEEPGATRVCLAG